MNDNIVWHITVYLVYALRWSHNGCDSLSNHQPYDCLLNRLFRRRSKKTSKPLVTGLCVGVHRGPVNSPHKWPVTRKMFQFDDVIMVSSNVKLMGLKYNLKKHWPVHGMLCYWSVKAIYNKNFHLKVFSAYTQEKNIWTKTVDTTILLFLVTLSSWYYLLITNPSRKSCKPRISDCNLQIMRRKIPIDYKRQVR